MTATANDYDTTVYLIVHTDPLTLPHEIIDVVGDVDDAANLAKDLADAERFTWTPGEERVGYASSGYGGLFIVYEYDVSVSIPAGRGGRDSTPTDRFDTNLDTDL